MKLITSAKFHLTTMSEGRGSNFCERTPLLEIWHFEGPLSRPGETPMKTYCELHRNLIPARGYVKCLANQRYAHWAAEVQKKKVEAACIIRVD